MFSRKQKNSTNNLEQADKTLASIDLAVRIVLGFTLLAVASCFYAVMEIASKL